MSHLLAPPDYPAYLPQSPEEQSVAAGVRCLVILLVTLACALVAPPAHAGEHARLGPLPQRVRHPLYLLHLQPTPGRAAVLMPGSVQVDVNGDWSNVFEKWSRFRPNGRQVSDLDMEIVRLATQVRVGLPWGFEVGLEVPLITMTGGVAERTIQNWHAALNAENGGRNFVEDFRFAWRVAVPDKFDHRITEPVVMALGDITVDVQGQILRPSRRIPGVSGRFLVKLPTGVLERGTGSGAPDVGVLLMAEHGWGFVNLYGQLGVLALGRTGQLANILNPAAFTASFTLELNITPHWSIVGQLHGHSTFLRGFAHRFMQRSPMAAMFGTRLQVGPMDLSLAMEQDILNGDPSADVSLVGSLGFTVGRRVRVGR